MTATAYRIFADNLLARTRQAGSIAELCRATGINRQQFNKYLSGSSLPSAKTLKKLADHFGIADIKFFERKGLDKASDTLALSSQPLKDLEKYSHGSTWSEGLYSLYCLWPYDPAFAMKGAMYVKRYNDRAEFRYYFRFQDPRTKAPEYITTRVRGLIFQGNAMIIMQGATKGQLHGLFTTAYLNETNQAFPKAWPIQSLSFLPSGLSYGQNSLLVQEKSNPGLKKAIRWTGIFAATGHHVPARILGILNEWQSGRSTALFPADYRDALKNLPDTVVKE